MDNELIRRIVEFVEEASPIIWAAVQREVMVSAVIDLVWAIVFLILAIIGTYIGVRCVRHYREDTYHRDGWDIAAGVMIGIAIIMLSLFGFYLTIGLRILANPDYHAIKGLIDLFPGT